MSTWPGGRRHAMTQSEHEAWNARNFPGTRQLCEQCGEPTGRCEDDSLYADEDRQIGPLCVECWNTENAEHEPRAIASRAPCSCSALVAACNRTIKYLREIGESTRGESTFPSAEYADAMADDLEHALKPNSVHHMTSTKEGEV